MAHDEDIDLVFTGPFANVMRPLTLGFTRSMIDAVSALFFFAGVAVLLYVTGASDIPGADRAAMAGLGVFVFVSALTLFFVRRLSAVAMAKHLPWLAVVFTLASTLGTATSVVAVGPAFGGAAVFFVELAVVNFLLLRRAWALGSVALSMVAYGVALVIVDPVAPEQYFINVLATAVASGVLLGGLAARTDDSRTAEAKAKSALRRFLAPEIADVVVSAGDDRLVPHECEVAVVFVDLRGFSEFTNNVGPERVVAVLSEYYAAVGGLLQEHGATIGGFDGDGIMAFVGDPVPHDKPAHDAVRMAQAIADRLDELVDAWSVDAHRVGYGMGVAFGVTTLGVVGFEGRYDYTAVGAVPNLAARLCASAASGEIVVDDATRETAGLVDVAPRPVAEFKGFGATKTWAVARG